MLDTGDWIALGAFLAACLAAVYAKATVKAAERANEISMHAERLKTYKGVLELQSLLRGRGTHFPQNEFWSKYDYVELTEFYFDVGLANKVKRYFQCGRDVIATREMWEEATAEGEEARKAAVRKTWDHFNAAIPLGDEIIEDFKRALRLK